MIRKLFGVLLCIACVQFIWAKGAGEDTQDQPQTLTMYEEAKVANDPLRIKMLDDFTAKTGIPVEINVVPGEGTDKFKTIEIALVSGEDVDVIRLDNPIVQHKFVSAGFLEDITKIEGVDTAILDSRFGKYLSYQDNALYYLPYEISSNIVFYNKKLFDEAGVEYPNGKWSWDDYLTTAEKITDSSAGIYGSLLQQWEYFLYFRASEAGVSAYKPNGTSNFDHEKFAVSLQFYKDLGSKYEVQPDWEEMIVDKIGWDSFMTGSYGMQIIGTWFLSLMADAENYPRDWGIGVTVPPGDNILTAGGAYGVNQNAKNPGLAMDLVEYLASNSYIYSGALPARVDLTKSDLQEIFNSLSQGFVNENDPTVQELYTVLSANELGIVPEQIVGKGSAEIHSIIKKEGEQFMLGLSTLEETIAKIKSQADIVLAESEE